jgi:hypothetical protein
VELVRSTSKHHLCRLTTARSASSGSFRAVHPPDRTDWYAKKHRRLPSPTPQAPCLHQQVLEEQSNQALSVSYPWLLAFLVLGRHGPQGGCAASHLGRPGQVRALSVCLHRRDRFFRGPVFLSLGKAITDLTCALIQADGSGLHDGLRWHDDRPSDPISH